MPNRILNSVNILYTPNIEDVKKYSNYASPNIFVVASNVNNGTYLGFDYYKGISYELYYIDNNRNIQQLTYNFVKGNGLFIKDNKFEIKIDNKTLINKVYKNKNYIVANTNTFKEASYLNRGVLSLENGIYYNDKYFDTIKDDGAFIIDASNKISLSNGLVHNLNMIKYYCKKCDIMFNLINELYLRCIKDINVPSNVKVGDILYYNATKRTYTLKSVNKNGSINKPVMVCVIGSHILPDLQPRFMPLKRKSETYIYDKSNTIYVKNALSKVPIYTTNDTSHINIGTKITASTYGYIAVKRDDWKNNIANPLDKTENYYTVNEKLFTYNTSIIQELKSQTLNWYVDATKINYNNNYIIMSNGVYTDNINSAIQKKISNKIVYVIITVKFNNGIIKYYLCNMKLNSNRLVNISPMYGYDQMKTITNNFIKVSNGATSYMAFAYAGITSDIANESIRKQPINFTYLNTAPINFIELSYNISETYVISNNYNLVSDTIIYTSEGVYVNNTYKFEIKASADGQLLISTTAGVLNKSVIMVHANTYSESITITNDTQNTISPIISIKLIPNDLTKYKYSTKIIEPTISGKKKEINTTIINSIKLDNLDQNKNIINTNIITTTKNDKKPQGGYAVLNNKVYEYSLNSGSC